MVVNSASALVQALTTAHAGDVILLAPGNYGRVDLSGLKFTGQVIIASQNPDAPAQIEYLSIKGCQGLTFSELTVQPAAGSCGAYLNLSSDIRFEAVDFHGLLDGDVTNEGSGISVRDSPNVTITKCEFYELKGGVSHLNSDGLTVTDNRMHDLMSDGVLGTGSDNVVISRNAFSDFHPYGGVHPDAIQFWTAPDAPTKNITVSDNTFVRGSGSVVQGIFITNESGTGYQNVKITGNAVVGSMYHGITLVGATDSIVSDNLVAGYADMVARITVKDGVNVTEAGNTATAYVLTNNVGLVQTDNVTIAQPAVGDTSVLSSWRAGQPIVTDGGTISGAPVEPPPLVTEGTAGADVLIGTAGADTMTGGAGNDTYIVNHTGDRLVEASGGGVDTVETSLSSYALPSKKLGVFVENVTLTGSGAQSVKGNELDNVLVGNKVNSSMSGGAGNDTLVSSGGHDFLEGGGGRDVFRFDALPQDGSKIRDFQVGMDKVDLSPLLDAYHGANPVADGWVQVVTTYGAGYNTKFYVDVDGPTGPAQMSLVTELSGVKVKLAMGVDWVF